MDMKIQDMDNAAALIDAVDSAVCCKRAVRIRGGDTKRFLGRPTEGVELDIRNHRGIVSYDPTELVVTARAGTPVEELDAVLDAAGQMLASEAPTFRGAATVGGMVASGLSGPRRPYSGSVRDFVLGCRMITGKGKHLRFGGEVMKNVAGYDVSRVMAGSFGSLGVITEVSLKVLPKPRATLSIAVAATPQNARAKLNKWAIEGVPVSAACHANGTLYVRVEGGHGSVKAARELVGGEEINAGFWSSLREFQLPFFFDERPLWRISFPAATPHIELPGLTITDWGGSQRWLKSEAPPETIRELAQRHGGHATCFSPNLTDHPFHPLSTALMALHQRLKKQMDPHLIFNPGRLYAEL